MGAPLSILPRSKSALLRLLLRGRATTSQLVARTHLHPTVVRGHMRELVQADLVEPTLLASKRGRPRAEFSLTQKGRELFFARYDTVLDSVARALTARGRSRSARQVFADAGRSLAQRLGGPRKESETVSLLQEIGFEPEVVREQGQRFMVSHNCPVLEVAKQHPDLLCDAFHCTFLGNLLGKSPRPLRQAISRGAAYCVHELDPPN